MPQPLLQSALLTDLYELTMAAAYYQDLPATATFELFVRTLPENRGYLKSRGAVVYLKCQPRELYLRTRHDKNRPLLQIDDPLKKLQELFAARHALYMASADIVLESGRQSAHCLVRRLENSLDLAGVALCEKCPPSLC